MKLHYLETGSNDPAWNLAFEEVVLESRRDDPYLILWQNDNTIVVGQNQNTEEEINRDFVEEHGIHVVRRMTGGGAVYHDMGNLNYSFIDDAGELQDISYERFTNAVVSALKDLGLDACASGRNDILVNGYKVSGTAQRLCGGRILYHGTLLFDSRPEMIAGALDADPLKFTSKSKKSVRTRVGNIRSFLKNDMGINEFKEYLLKYFGKDGFETDKLSETELEQVSKLKKDKYDTWQWTFGRSPKFNLSAKRKWDGGIVDIRIDVENGIINEIKFYGDYLSLRPISELEKSLVGCRFDPAEVSKSIGNYFKLSGYKITELFGSVTEQELLDTMFSKNQN